MSLRGLGAGGAALQVLMAGTWEQPRFVCSVGVAQLGEEGQWERLDTAFIIYLFLPAIFSLHSLWMRKTIMGEHDP